MEDQETRLPHLARTRDPRDRPMQSHDLRPGAGVPGLWKTLLSPSREARTVTLASEREYEVGIFPPGFVANDPAEVAYYQRVIPARDAPLRLYVPADGTLRARRPADWPTNALLFVGEVI